MKKRPYSQILDAMAGDQVRNDIDLAPTIIAHIQKGKGFRMQPKTKLVSAILVVVIMFVVPFYTVPGVAAALGRWFGYVPGVGLVQDGSVRVLAEPVSVTREGITVTVDQVVLNQQRTALIYSVEGIPSAASSTQPEKPLCNYKVSLRLPDGTPLLASPNGVQSWGSGYQHRFNYPPVPGGVKDAKLVISCLFLTRPGAAPENWEIPLHFVSAPLDMTAFPVIEIPTPTAAERVAPTASATQAAAPDPASSAESITLTLDRAVQMTDGYLLYATLHWEDTSLISVDMINLAETLHLLDGSGQEMLYEIRDDEQTGVNVDQRQTVFAIKTAPVQTLGPLTLVLDSVLVELPVQASFVFDPGLDPKPGQEWQPNLTVTIGEQRLLVRSIIASESGYEVGMTSDTGIQKAGVGDLEHPVASGYCTDGGNSQEMGFGCGFNYANGLPIGPITISIGSIGVQHIRQLQAQWTPPAASTTLLPTQPAACLTVSGWKTTLSQPPALPDGLPGKVLVYGPADKNWTGGEWQVALTNLDGTHRQVITGARDGALSPDGTKLAYSTTGAGILIQDLASGETHPVPSTADGDFNPIWSLDGKQIVFNRGGGIFDLFIVNRDGSNLRQLTQGGVQENTVGWLPDGSLLYSVPGRENEYTIYQRNLQSGESKLFSHENIQSISPDGKHIAFGEMIFGEQWQISISELDGANRWRLVDAGLRTQTPLWSPDGQWLLAGVTDTTDTGATIGALINLRTCQVIPLPNLRGNFLAWVP